MYTAEFWKATGERAGRTFVQMVVTLTMVTFGAEVTGVINVLELDWANIGTTVVNIVGTSLIGAGLSVLMSLGAGRKDGNPSAGTLEAVAPSKADIGH